ncbi:MAG: hypothetical protein ACI9TH_001723 [Kiritimatiellia bacterium]|jgi:hypothetical protein
MDMNLQGVLKDELMQLAYRVFVLYCVLWTARWLILACAMRFRKTIQAMMAATILYIAWMTPYICFQLQSHGWGPWEWKSHFWHFISPYVLLRVGPSGWAPEFTHELIVGHAINLALGFTLRCICLNRADHWLRRPSA